MRFVLCLLFLLSFADNVLSQTKIYGHILDTVTNTVLRSVSVSIYPEGMKTVEKVTLTDRFGKFIVERLPHNQVYKAEFSYQGYQKLTKEFSLHEGQELDFGRLHLERQIYEIEEVHIVPPVRMNGDTIEFNTDAFQLDTNSVIEDLIHKLPGMIVWGDGKITYNGKEIPSVLINGKEFFGSDKSISLRNIAKEAVKKVQVYDIRDKQSQRENPMDPTYEMNVVLKDGKENMVFGNVTVGIGTDKRYENYLSINYANKRGQSSIGYANNNTNKKLNSLDQLLKNTTYKGVGIHADYHSDFNRPGINQQHVLAARHQHDFLAMNETNRKNIITGNIFSNWNKENLTNTSNTIVSGGSGDQINQRTYESVAITNHKSLEGDVKYELAKEIKGRNTQLNTDLNLSTAEEDSHNSSEIDYEYSNNQSRNTRQEYRNVDRQSVALVFSANWGAKNLSHVYEMGRKPTIVDKLKYGLSWNASFKENNLRNENNTQIENQLNSEANQNINRLYDKNNQAHDQQFTFIISNRKDRFRIINPIDFNYLETNQRVRDVDGNTEISNIFLSHESSFRQLIYTPRIEYSHYILEKNYIGIFSEHLSLKPELSVRFLNRNNISTLDYRNIEQHFVSYLPKLELKYGYSKYGAYLFTSKLGYHYNEELPSVDQLQPIYDDINPAYRYFGNPNLSRTAKQTLSGFLRFQEHKSRGLTANFNTSYNITSAGIRDSIVFAPNQQQVFSVNMAKDMYDFDMRLNVSRPFTIKKDQTFTFEVDASSFWSKSYQYIDSELQELSPTNQSINFTTYYTCSNRYQLRWRGGYNRYDSRNLTALDHSFSSVEYSTTVSMSWALIKNMKIGSDVSGRFINANSFHNELTIWNANIAHRFTKGNNLEAKLTVYDILNQNKGIYIKNGTTELTRGYNNNLRQFFQITLSYYPRKFGL